MLTGSGKRVGCAGEGPPLNLRIPHFRHLRLLVTLYWVLGGACVQGRGLVCQDFSETASLQKKTLRFENFGQPAGRKPTNFKKVFPPEKKL